MAKNDEPTAEVVEEVTDVDTDDDQGESEELDAVFEDAVKAAPVEEGSEEKEPQASESATAEEKEEPAPETVEAEAAIVVESAEEPETPATVEEPPKEEPLATQPAVEIPAPPDPAQVLAEYETWRGNAETLLAEQHYNLSEEQAEEFDTDLGKAIPKLAARLHMEVMQQSVAMIAGLLPKIMANVSQAQIQETARETAFFKEWPELKVHREQVVRHGAMYIQLNPGASIEDFTRDVGAQVAVAAKVDLSGRAPASVEVEKTPAHKPIASSGGSGVPVPVAKPGVFEGLYNDAVASDSEF